MDADNIDAVILLGWDVGPQHHLLTVAANLLRRHHHRLLVRPNRAVDAVHGGQFGHFLHAPDGKLLSNKLLPLVTSHLASQQGASRPL